MTGYSIPHANTQKAAEQITCHQICRSVKKLTREHAHMHHYTKRGSFCNCSIHERFMRSMLQCAHMNASNIIVMIIVVALIIVGIWFVIVRDKTGSTMSGSTVTLTGTIVCLPHKSSSGGPTTLECTYGLLDPTTNGYYELQTSATSSVSLTNYPTGSSVTVTGTLASTPGTMYDTVGMIYVESITPEGATAGSNTQNGTSTQSGNLNTTSDGTITFSIPDGYGLAVTQEQMPQHTSVPPCASGFDYCIYYNGADYASTSLQSAGVNISAHTGYAASTTCLTTPPDGFAAEKVSATSTGTGYEMSAFGPLSEGAAGSGSVEEAYRLWTNATCYALTSRVGFSNVPTGSTTVLSNAQKQTILESLRGIVRAMRINSTNEALIIPTL